MKILFCIVNHGLEAKQYLDKVIATIWDYPRDWDIDIIIHTSVALDYKTKYPECKGITITEKLIHLDRYDFLPFTTRRTIYENRDNYDLFIYSENDHLWEERHIRAYMLLSERLPLPYLPGHIQYEQYPDCRFYACWHADYNWTGEVFHLPSNNETLAVFSNKHQGSYFLTKKQLAYICKHMDFMNDHPAPYGTLEQAGGDIYHCPTIIKVIPISDFNNFSVQHLPNKYRNIFGHEESEMNAAIEKLLATPNKTII